MLRILGLLWHGLIFGRLPPKRCRLHSCDKAWLGCRREMAADYCANGLCDEHCKYECECLAQKTRELQEERRVVRALLSA